MTKANISSPEFILKLKQGDKQSFEYLYDHYAPNLLGVISAIVKPTDQAEDVLQKGFIKIWSNIDKYDAERGTFFTWMLNICRNLAIDEYRKIRREQDKVNRGGQKDVHKEIEVQEGDFRGGDHRNGKKLHDAILKLPEDQRHVIENLYLGGLTQKELSEADDIPLGTIKSRVRLAMNKLRETLKLILFWI